MKKKMSTTLMVCIVLTIVYATFILTNIYAQEDMLMSDLGWTMTPVAVPWGIYFVWRAIKKNPSKSKLADEIKELKKLYKEGDLSKEEFTKAKNKILNQ